MRESHGIMRTLENLCTLLPKALKRRAKKDTMASSPPIALMAQNMHLRKWRGLLFSILQRTLVTLHIPDSF